MKVIKRDGREVPFEVSRIKTAIIKANKSIEEAERIPEDEIDEIVESVAFDIGEEEKIDIEKIQDAVEEELMKTNGKVAKSFILFREERSKARRKNSDFRKITKEKLTASNVQNSNANVDEYSFGGRFGEAANETAKQVALDELMSEKTRKNHENNEIYQHDLNSWAVGSHNCLSVPVDDLLKYGFNTRQTDIRPASSLNTAFQLIAVILQIQSLQQFGGVSCTHIDWTMVPYFRLSFVKHYNEVAEILDNKKIELSKEEIKNTSIENYKENIKNYEEGLKLTIKELKQSVEGMYHNLNSLQSRSGNQLPFSSINYGTCTLPEGRLIIKALLDGSIKGVGKWGRTSIFPCGIFQYKKGINDEVGTPNYDLFQLAIKSTAQRLYPNYANADWTNQISWVKQDRNIKQKVIDNLSEEEKEKLISLIKENPEIGKKLSLKIEE